MRWLRTLGLAGCLTAMLAAGHAFAAEFEDENAEPPRAHGPLNLVPAGQRRVNQHNLTELHRLILIYQMTDDDYPKSLREMVETGQLHERELVRCPTRRKPDGNKWRFDYALLPNLTDNEPSNRPMLWDKPGNFGDGGMMVGVDGAVRVFRQFQEGEWERVHKGLMSRSDREFLEKKLPGMNFSGFKD